MSKIRENLVINDSALETPGVPDGEAYVVFTKKRDDLPHKFAGYINAPDAELGLAYAREHYGQDEECVSLWLAPTASIGGAEASHAPHDEPGANRAFEVFVQQNEGGWHLHAGTVDAPCARSALDKAGAQIKETAGAHSVWVIVRQDITATGPDDLIWRHVSQDYRLARGYSKEVREKWERIRAAEEVDRYQEEDLKEAF